MGSREYTEVHVLFIKELFYQSTDWEVITNKFNKKFGTDKTAIALQNALRRDGDMFELESEEVYVDRLRDLRRTKRTSAQVQRENNKILDYLSMRDEVIEAVNNAVSNIKVSKVKPKVIKKSTTHNMTMELLLSDLHYGKLTSTFNAKVSRERMQQLTAVFIREYKDQSRMFNVGRIIVALLGDIIESYTMHGLESAASCEMGNSEQIVLAITSIFEDVIAPLAALGVTIDVPCVTGNHDRTERDKTFNDVGKSNVTWIIYNTLKALSEAHGYKNVNFQIAEKNYLLFDIYHNKCLYEHGDLCKSTNKSVIESHLAARTKQLGSVIDFMRLGHWHEVTMYEQGRIIINGSLPGQDSYADVKGYNSQAFQVINYYIKTEERPNCFYKSFPVYLG